MPRVAFVALVAVGLTACFTDEPLQPTEDDAALEQPRFAAASIPVITDLGALPGNDSSGATALNDLGAVVGWSKLMTEYGPYLRAALWATDGTVRELSSLGGLHSYAEAINNHGVVVGQAMTGLSYTHAFRWSAATGMQDLAARSDLTQGHVAAFDINDAGFIVGESAECTLVCYRRAVIWVPGIPDVRMHNLFTLPGGRYSRAKAVNAAAAVVGFSEIRLDGWPYSREHAFLFTGDPALCDDRTCVEGMRSLGTLPDGESSWAEDINDGGLVVGSSLDADRREHAVLWLPDGSIRDLGFLPGGNRSRALAVNNDGVAVGWALTGSGQKHAFVWTPAGGMQDLGTLPGGTTSEATDINAGGVIVGHSSVASGTLHAVRWGSGTGPVNRPPAARAGGPYGAPEGSSISFDASGSSDPDGDALTFAWDLGDGATANVSAPTHAYSDNGTFTVTLTVSDGNGGTSTATTTAVIANVAPTVTPLADAAVSLCEAYTASGAFTDPGADTWSATVDYGDGGGAQALALSGKSFDLSHTYAAAGSYAVRVAVSDDDGGTGTGQGTVTVRSAQDELQLLPARIDALVAAGVLSDGNGKSLKAKLNAAIDQLNRGNKTAAGNQMNAFVNKVEALVRAGKIPADVAPSLLDVIARISCAIG